jgi:bifunctional DNA-binding transcriptional regulator/antitoxin component of YhaV-PrlF toxin-antitoxin module
MSTEIVQMDAKGRLLVKSWMRKLIGIRPGDKLLIKAGEDCLIAEKVI